MPGVPPAVALTSAASQLRRSLLLSLLRPGERFANALVGTDLPTWLPPLCGHVWFLGRLHGDKPPHLTRLLDLCELPVGLVFDLVVFDRVPAPFPLLAPKAAVVVGPLTGQVTLHVTAAETVHGRYLCGRKA